MDSSQLAKAIRAKTTVQDPVPIAATVHILQGTAARALEFDADHLLLFSSMRPSESTASYLYRLAKEARDKAYSRACSSLLAGEGNEGDDTGDVAFWLGEGDYSSAEKVLKALGIDGEATQHALPSDLESTLESMSGKFSFRAAGDDARMLFFVVGEIAGGWGGLAGVGTWT